MERELGVSARQSCVKENSQFDSHSKKALIAWTLGWATLGISPVASVVILAESARQMHIASKQSVNTKQI